MDKVQFYRILNIDSVDEFQYYENVEALLEEELLIESNLIVDLLKDIDIELLSKSIDTYFETYLGELSDSQTDLFILITQIKEEILRKIPNEGESNDYHDLAEAICKFRKWYVLDKLVFDEKKGIEISVRDARFDALAAKFFDEECMYNYDKALNYDLEGLDYEINILR